MSIQQTAIGYSDGDIDTNPTANRHLSDIVTERYSRRSILGGGMTAASVFFGGSLLAACGSDGGSSTGPNTPPSTTSAAPPSARAGTSIVLSGGASDVEGAVASTSWTQVAGPTAIIDNAGTTSARAVVGNVTARSNATFRFTATDAGGATSSSDVTVAIDPAQLGFAPVAKSLADTVAVPEGYTVTVLYRLGDPLTAATAAYANNGTDTGFATRAGDHHDGMSFFGLAATGTARDDASSSCGLLVMNHENINQLYLHPTGPTTVGGARPEAEALKEIECHGVSVVEVALSGGPSSGGTSSGGIWAYNPGSTLNRRVTPFTPTTFNGPARGSALLRTAFSPTGTAGRGTLNNCANGFMPWGTYLTCEENWAGYFRRDASDAGQRTPRQNVAFARYGLSIRTGNYGWATVSPSAGGDTRFAKFNITTQPSAPADGSGDFRNEANQFGWVVEIDPYDPAATPRKRTALGRMNHEGCWPGRRIAGVRPAFYMGDDAQNEYVYKFVSTAPWAAADATAADRLAVGDKYLDAGTLYVARFNPDGSGTWIPLVFGQNGITATNATYAFADQADVLTHCRLAADVVGATRMDRPEWTAVNPATGEMYCTLTNNSSRTTANTDPSNPRAYTDLKLPQGDQVNADPPTAASRTSGNANGHIIRLREAGDTTEATGFSWDIYAFGAGADLDRTNINLSGLDATNDFSSPDGLWFGRPSNASGQVSPVLWIETDDGAYTDVTNCMLLAAIPGRVGDGTTATISNRITTTAGVVTTGTQTTRFGTQPGTNLRRFLVGPKECEITGIDSTPDGRALFVNVQHPGENATNPNAPTSNWPANQAAAAPGVRPRSATIVITKNDGGVVGL